MRGASLICMYASFIAACFAPTEFLGGFLIIMGVIAALHFALETVKEPKL